MAFVRAERKRAKARIGICGPAGSGKTMSGLRVAFGIVGPTGRIAVIDTEHGSASLYADLGPYDVMELQAPFTVQKYISAIHDAEKQSYDLIFIDSLSHAWAGAGGLLELVDKKAGDKGNKFAGWRDATPLHNELVEAMLQSPIHVIATMRSKTEYVLEEDDRGKKVPKKVGLAPVQRDGMDFEFTLVFDVDQGNHRATASKDRTSLFKTVDQAFNQTLTEAEGQLIKNWLETGVQALPVQHASSTPAGSGATPMFINGEQVATIEKLMEETAADRSKLLAVYKIERLEQLPANRYAEVIKAFEKKKEGKGQPAASSSTAESAIAGTAETGTGSAPGNIGETLKARSIPFEVIDGAILAKPPFNDGAAREFLKSQGFKWDASGKAWKHAA